MPFNIMKYISIGMNVIKNLKNNIFKSHVKPTLGRWGQIHDMGENKCLKKEELLIRQANMDNCGDLICGIPKYEKSNK